MDPDFHEWRRQGITGSMIPAIMGVSPWQDCHDVWLYLTKRDLPKPPNQEMQRGVNLEPVVREMYEKRADAEFPAGRLVYDDMPIFRANFDGWNDQKRKCIEIKCPNAEDHLSAVKGKVPEKYYPQVQWLIMVGGGRFECCDYVSFSDNEMFAESDRLTVVQVTPDAYYMKQMAEHALKLWEYVEMDSPPPGLLLSEDKSLESLLSDYERLDIRMKAMKKMHEEYREQIEKACGESERVLCSGFEVKFSPRKGAVDYAQIMSDHGVVVDLEKYRKDPSKTMYIKRVKE